MWRRLRLLSLSLAVVACSTATLTDPRSSCGALSVRGVTGPRLDPMKPIPACELPTAPEIDRACERRQAGVSGVWPDYEVKALRCAFLNQSHSRASCSFDLTDMGSPAAARRVGIRFAYRYYEVVGEPDASGWETYWEAEGLCLGAAAEASP